MTELSLQPAPELHESQLAARALAYARQVQDTASYWERLAIMLYGSYITLRSPVPSGVSWKFRLALNANLPAGYMAYQKSLDDESAARLDDMIAANVYTQIEMRVLGVSR